MDGVSHTVEVTAATLYEAVAQGLAAIRGNEWVAGIAKGFNVVKVSVGDVRVEHEVKLGDFTKWLEKAGDHFREPRSTSLFSEPSIFGVGPRTRRSLKSSHREMSRGYNSSAELLSFPLPS